MQDTRIDLHRLVDSLPEHTLSRARAALNECHVRNGSVELPGAAFLEHVALWVSDLERARTFYERWFRAKAGPPYSSTKRLFRSQFLSLDGGSRLEIMDSPNEPARPAHIAVSVGSCAAVDELVKQMQSAGISVRNAPRQTGDGYYEAVVLDSEGNPVEITA